MDYMSFNGNDFFSELKAIDLLALAKELDNILLEYRDSLGLERKVRFGLELEYEGFPKEKTDEYLKKLKVDWTSITDESLSSGGEIKSPKLIDERKTWENLKLICEFLKLNKADTCHSAGLHIHVGAHIFGENIEAWRRFAKIYTAYERVLIRFGYGDKVNARSSIFSYAKPIGLSLLENISKLNENKNLRGIKEFYKPIYDVKKNAINLRSFEFLSAIANLNTLEFRNFNATSNEVVIQNNINAVCKLMLAALRRNLDEDYLDFKLRKLQEMGLSEKEYLNQCSEVLLREMAEFVDLIFDNNEDKIYFMRQYLKNLETSTRKEAVMARELSK